MNLLRYAVYVLALIEALLVFFLEDKEKRNVLAFLILYGICFVVTLCIFALVKFIFD